MTHRNKPAMFLPDAYEVRHLYLQNNEKFLELEPRYSSERTVFSKQNAFDYYSIINKPTMFVMNDSGMTCVLNVGRMVQLEAKIPPRKYISI
jgi:hypothetical protein